MFVIMEKIVDNRISNNPEKDKFEAKFTTTDRNKAFSYVEAKNIENALKRKQLQEYLAQIKIFSIQNPRQRISSSDLEKMNMEEIKAQEQTFAKEHIVAREKLLGPMPEFVGIANYFYIEEVPELE